MSLKRVLLFSLCILVLSGLVGCREKRNVLFENDISEEIIGNSNESQISAGELEKAEIIDKSGFVERFLELSLFYGLSSPLNSEMICIFPYF